MRDTIETGTDRIVHDGKYIQVLERPYRNRETDYSGHWNVVQRKTFDDIVVVVPVTTEGNVVFIDQYRIPRRGRVIEFCAGLCDKQGEDLVELAKRELREETGYEADTLELIIRGAVNPGLSNEDMSIYLALNARKVSDPELEGAEDIRVFEVPLAEAQDWLTQRMLTHAVDIKLIGVISFVRRKLGV